VKKYCNATGGGCLQEPGINGSDSRSSSCHGLPCHNGRKGTRPR